MGIAVQQQSVANSLPSRCPRDYPQLTVQEIGRGTGRPYDNQHALTSVEESGTTLIIVLDRKLMLRFDGLKSIKAHKRELVLGPFEKLRFDWERLGTDGKRGTKEYEAGEVKILTGP